MRDYSRWFANAEPANEDFEIINLGEVYLPTGAVFCCDPFLSHEVSALNRTVAPGSYPVKLCVAKSPTWGRRVALAEMMFTDRIPATWEKATYELNGTRLSSFRVDAGLACFMDAQTAEVFAEVVHNYYETVPDGNYYDDLLAVEFKRSADPLRPTHIGDWDLHFPIQNDPRNIAMFASGLGDGAYSAFWGLGSNHQPCLLVIDFEILDNT